MCEETYYLRKMLDSLKDSGQTVKVILRNGYQIGGQVRGWDSKSILMHINGQQQLVMMQAVSTIVPDKPVDFWTKK